jgi:short-subunit dehydrogenase
VGEGCATYCATKFGVAGFSEAVALELRGTGVEMSIVRPSLCKTELTSGFRGLRGMPFIEPEDVAARILEVLQRPRFDVPVPRSMGPMLWLNQALPFRARAALAHVTKADAAMSQIDADARAAYIERITADTPEPTKEKL